MSKYYENQGRLKNTKNGSLQHREIMKPILLDALEELFPNKNWIVHHRNGNPKNNDIFNLEIMILSKHSSLHNKNRKCTEERRKNQSLGHRGKTWSKFPYAHYRRDRKKWETRVRFLNYIKRFMWFNDPISASIVGKLIVTEGVNGHGR